MPIDISNRDILMPRLVIYYYLYFVSNVTLVSCHFFSVVLVLSFMHCIRVMISYS